MKNLKIGTRLGFGFALVLVLLTAMTIIGILRLSVCNDGPGNATDELATQGGVGLDNLRTRLRILHGEQSELQLTRAGSGHAEVIVTLPLREA